MKFTEEEKKGLELCQKLRVLRLIDNMVRLNQNKHPNKRYGKGVELNPTFISHLGKVEKLESASSLDKNAVSGILSRYCIRVRKCTKGDQL